jgi:fatty-acyl-CoA synthase
MSSELIETTSSTYPYPLLIRELLQIGLDRAPEQEIVYADKQRMTYWALAARVGRLASGLTSLGVRPSPCR